jgi:hypothetical protein
MSRLALEQFEDPELGGPPHPRLVISPARLAIAGASLSATSMRSSDPIMASAWEGSSSPEDGAAKRTREMTPARSPGTVGLPRRASNAPIAVVESQRVCLAEGVGFEGDRMGGPEDLIDLAVGVLVPQVVHVPAVVVSQVAPVLWARVDGNGHGCPFARTARSFGFQHILNGEAILVIW